ncbi:MAG: malate dehydrogenase [Candidatus Diapherotrites archaeon]
MKKVTIIGAGNVGATAAFVLGMKGICDIVLIDKFGDMAKGKAIDLTQCISAQGINSKIIGTGDFSEMKDSDIIIITAGIPRKPGMTRDDLIKINKEIIGSICKEIKNYSKDSILINVTNPMDAITNFISKQIDIPKNKLIGMGGVLDGMRFAQKIKKRINLSFSDISTMVIGEHGNGMIPVPEYTTIKGIPITELIEKEEIEKIIEDTKNGGLEIVELLKNGSAFYAPGNAIAIMVKSILNDEKNIVCACSYLKENDVFIGMPVVLGKDGVEKVIMPDLSDELKEKFENSISSLKSKL